MSAAEVLSTPQSFVNLAHSNSRPDAAAVAAVVAAIQSLNIPQNGINFSPFTIKAVTGTFNNVWNSQRGNTPITFFQSNGSAGGGYLPLGDVAMIGSYDPNVTGTAPGNQLLFSSPSDRAALAHPTGFGWILDDKGSGNSRDLVYWAIGAPAGYTAMGIAFSNGPMPDVNNYWCVRNDLVRGLPSQAGFWGDNGQHWKSHNGNLNVGVLNNAETPAEPAMLFVPPTFLSAEGGTPAYAMVMQQAELAITPFAPPDPQYDPTINSGDETSYGLASVKIVPYTAVADPGVLSQSSVSPFYFVAAEPYWLCTESLSTPNGGSFTVTVTVGTAQSESQSFTNSTSMTVSATVGAQYGPASASMSASYTNSFSTTTAQSSSGSTQVEQQLQVNLPAQPRTWFWERQTQISVFRSDKTQVRPVTYSGKDLIFVPAGPHA